MWRSALVRFSLIQSGSGLMRLLTWCRLTWPDLFVLFCLIMILTPFHSLTIILWLHDSIAISFRDVFLCCYDCSPCCELWEHGRFGCYFSGVGFFYILELYFWCTKEDGSLKILRDLLWGGSLLQEWKFSAILRPKRKLSASTYSAVYVRSSWILSASLRML